MALRAQQDHTAREITSYSLRGPIHPGSPAQVSARPTEQEACQPFRTLAPPALSVPLPREDQGCARHVSSPGGRVRGMRAPRSLSSTSQIERDTHFAQPTDAGLGRALSTSREYFRLGGY
jgi:hypothetical protein